MIKYYLTICIPETWLTVKTQMNAAQCCILSGYYTIIDFNEVDIRIYLLEKVIIYRGR